MTGLIIYWLLNGFPVLSPKKLYIANFLSGLLPPTRMYPIKSSLYKWAGVTIGINVRIVSSARIVGSGRLSIGDNTFVGHYTKVIVGDGSIEIGSDVDVSSNVLIINGSHRQHDVQGKAAGSGYSGDIKVRDGAWIGASATLIVGAEVGECSIVAAGATVVGRVESFDTVGGVPAKKIRSLSARRDS